MEHCAASVEFSFSVTLFLNISTFLQCFFMLIYWVHGCKSQNIYSVLFLARPHTCWVCDNLTACAYNSISAVRKLWHSIILIIISCFSFHMKQKSDRTSKFHLLSSLIIHTLLTFTSDSWCREVRAADSGFVLCRPNCATKSQIFPFLWFHRVAVRTPAFHADDLGFDSQRSHMAGASRGQPVPTHRLLTEEFHQCGINGVHLKKLSFRPFGLITAAQKDSLSYRSPFPTSGLPPTLWQALIYRIFKLCETLWSHDCVLK